MPIYKTGIELQVKKSTKNINKSVEMFEMRLFSFKIWRTFAKLLSFIIYIFNFLHFLHFTLRLPLVNSFQRERYFCPQ